MAAQWFGLAGASLENKEINHLHNNTLELLEVKFSPFISIQMKNIFVLPCQRKGGSPGHGAAGVGSDQHWDQLSPGSLPSGNGVGWWALRAVVEVPPPSSVNVRVINHPPNKLKEFCFPSELLVNSQLCSGATAGLGETPHRGFHGLGWCHHSLCYRKHLNFEASPELFSFSAQFNSHMGCSFASAAPAAMEGQDSQCMCTPVHSFILLLCLFHTSASHQA